MGMWQGRNWLSGSGNKSWINHWTEEPSLESAQSVSKYPVMQNNTFFCSSCFCSSLTCVAILVLCLLLSVLWACMYCFWTGSITADESCALVTWGNVHTLWCQCSLKSKLCFCHPVIPCNCWWWKEKCCRLEWPHLWQCLLVPLSWGCSPAGTVCWRCWWRCKWSLVWGFFVSPSPVARCFSTFNILF